MSVKQFDTVNNPSHYTCGDIECIDAMESAYGIDAVMAFCQCNAFKYQWRFPNKNGIEDLHKAHWYNQKYEELQEKKRKLDLISEELPVNTYIS